MRAARTASLNLRERWENRRPGAADAEEMRVAARVAFPGPQPAIGMSLHEAVQSLSYPEEHPRIGEDIRWFIWALETAAAWGLSPHLACEQVLDEDERDLRPHSRERLRDLSLSLRMSENAGAPLATSLGGPPSTPRNVSMRSWDGRARWRRLELPVESSRGYRSSGWDWEC